MQPAYNEDLAYVHDAGFGHTAKHAAPFVVESLESSRIEDGIVVDLGCGSGITSRLFRDAGFGVMGIDLSRSMIDMARERVPDGDFRVGSFLSVEFPRCVAVTAIGEVLNYRFDGANVAASRSQLFERVHDALLPGGVFVFDMAGPARAPSPGPQQKFMEGSDWVVLLEVNADEPKQELTRRITTFRRQGEVYRREEETHRLQLVDSEEIAATLRRVGFSVRTSTSYGSLRLPEGLVVFVARKEGGAAASTRDGP